MQPRHVTLADPSLPHQVVFTADGGGPAMVSCNCRATGQGHNGRGRGHDPMGPALDLAAARVLYDDPGMHRRPFDPTTDKARW